MAQNKLEEQKNTAAGWCLAAAVLIPVAFGIWRGWPGPWWAYVIAGVVIFLGVLGGWVQATQDADTHRAVTDMNERQKASEERDQ